MKLSEFESYIRTIVPSANSQKIKQTKLWIIINKGVRKVNTLGKILTKSGYFNAAADTGEYTISDFPSSISDFVLVGESGLWYNKGSVASPFYRELEGTDRSHLNVRFPNWHVIASGNPLYAIFDANLVTIYPKPPTALTNGFFLPDYVYKPTDMSNDDHYPFTGSTTELATLEPLDDAIIDYCRWILGLSVGKDQQGVITRQEYEATVGTSTRLVKRRPDFKSNRDNRIRGRRRS